MFRICNLDSNDLVSIYQRLSSGSCFVRFGDLREVHMIEVRCVQELKGINYYRLTTGELIPVAKATLYVLEGDDKYVMFSCRDATRLYTHLINGANSPTRIYRNRNGQIVRERDHLGLLPFLRLASKSNLYAGTLLLRVGSVVRLSDRFDRVFATD